MTILSRMAILEIYRKGHTLVLSPIEKTITIDGKLTYSVSHETALALVILIPINTSRFTILQKSIICDKIITMSEPTKSAQEQTEFVTVRIVKDGIETFLQLRSKPESYYHSRTFNKAKQQAGK